MAFLDMQTDNRVVRYWMCVTESLLQDAPAEAGKGGRRAFCLSLEIEVLPHFHLPRSLLEQKQNQESKQKQNLVSLSTTLIV